MSQHFIKYIEYGKFWFLFNIKLSTIGHCWRNKKILSRIDTEISSRQRVTKFQAIYRNQWGLANIARHRQTQSLRRRIIAETIQRTSTRLWLFECQRFPMWSGFGLVSIFLSVWWPVRHRKRTFATWMFCAVRWMLAGCADKCEVNHYLAPRPTNGSVCLWAVCIH